VHRQVPRLLLDPGGVWVARHSGDAQLPRADVDEDQDVERHLAAVGPDVLGEIAAGPERVLVAFDEQVPVALGAPWRWVKAVLD